MNIEEIDIKLLTAFDTIYDARSISRASNILDINQPTLSNRLRRLRKLLNDQLFYRSGHGVAPTPRAIEMIESVQKVLSTLQTEFQDIQSFNPETDVKTYNLLIADPLEPILVPPLIANLPKNLSINLRPPQSVEVELGLETGEIDAAVFLLPARKPNIVNAQLMPVDLVALVRWDHPRIQNHLSRKQLTAERHISLSIDDCAVANTEKVDIWQPFNFQTVCRTCSISSSIRLAAETDYITLAPRITAMYFSRIYKLRILELPIPINDQSFFLSWHKNLQHDKANIWLRSKIQDIVREVHG